MPANASQGEVGKGVGRGEDRWAGADWERKDTLLLTLAPGLGTKQKHSHIQARIGPGGASQGKPLAQRSPALSHRWVLVHGLLGAGLHSTT